MRLQELDLEELDLPAPGDTTVRWTATLKERLLAAVDEQEVPLADLKEAYSLSPEELAEWRRQVVRFGNPGLRTTRSQMYREIMSAKNT